MALQNKFNGYGLIVLVEISFLLSCELVIGGLHIEMNVMKLLGGILTGSGWTTNPVQSEVTTSGRPDTILKGCHVTRSRYIHQVTSVALHLHQVPSFQ